LRAVAPGVTVILGGPEVSHEHEGQRICALADHVVTGPGEAAFRRLCEEVLAGRPPAARVVSGGAPAPDSLALPYALYGDEDLRHRFLYVEASRGCPFRCEFC